MATVTVALKTPIKVGEKEIAEVKIDVDEITGEHIMFAIAEATAVKGPIVSYPIDTEVHVQMACKLSGLDRASLMKMKGKDFSSVVDPVRHFFLSMD